MGDVRGHLGGEPELVHRRKTDVEREAGRFVRRDRRATFPIDPDDHAAWCGRDVGSGGLPFARGPAELVDRLAQVSGPLRPTFGQAAPVGVDEHPVVDTDPVFDAAPGLLEERAGLAFAAELE
nr:hypothetical protein [Frankia sp. Cas4]